MSIKFLRFDQVNPDDLLNVLNEKSLRTHLVDHPRFDSASIRSWIAGKTELDSQAGCQVRVVEISDEVAGWCGIQPDENGFELAIVLSQRFWGHGISIFKTLMLWASELGHNEVVFHLLDTRREYKSLTKMATKVCRTQILGRNFTTYYLAVGSKNK